MFTVLSTRCEIGFTHAECGRTLRDGYFKTLARKTISKWVRIFIGCDSGEFTVSSQVMPRWLLPTDVHRRSSWRSSPAWQTSLLQLQVISLPVHNTLSQPQRSHHSEYWLICQFFSQLIVYSIKCQIVVKHLHHYVIYIQADAFKCLVLPNQLSRSQRYSVR